MNLFVIAAVVLTGLAVATVVWPLLRKAGDAPAAPVAAFVLGLALPAAVLIIYLSASNHDWSVPPPANSTASTASGGVNTMPSDIDEMVTNLENRLRAEPENVEGWLMLGRTYAQLQQVAESRHAYGQALSLDPSPEAKLGVAEADILLDRDNLMGDAGRLVEEVLEVEPQNPKALFYGGMVAMVRNDIDTFRDRWQRLLTLSPPDEIRAVIEAQLAMVDAAPGQISTTEQNPGISVSVSVSAGVAEQINPEAVLYLVARDPDRPGPPVAVVRHPAARLPTTLNISDSNAMTPGRLLSSLPRVQLIARITNSGKPVAQPGDLFGETAWIANKDGDEGLSIVIDRVVE